MLLHVRGFTLKQRNTFTLKVFLKQYFQPFIPFWNQNEELHTQTVEKSEQNNKHVKHFTKCRGIYLISSISKFFSLDISGGISLILLWVICNCFRQTKFQIQPVKEVLQTFISKLKAVCMRLQYCYQLLLFDGFFYWNSNVLFWTKSMLLIRWYHKNALWRHSEKYFLYVFRRLMYYSNSFKNIFYILNMLHTWYRLKHIEADINTLQSC